MRSRLEWFASTRTALRLHVSTAISPPKLLTSRRAPLRTGTVVSVCCRARAARVVSVVSIPSVLSSFGRDRKSTRLNSSHSQISYAVFCLKKKKKDNTYLIEDYRECHRMSEHVP